MQPDSTLANIWLKNQIFTKVKKRGFRSWEGDLWEAERLNIFIGLMFFACSIVGVFVFIVKNGLISESENSLGSKGSYGPSSSNPCHGLGKEIGRLINTRTLTRPYTWRGFCLLLFCCCCWVWGFFFFFLPFFVWFFFFFALSLLLLLLLFDYVINWSKMADANKGM